MYLGLFLFLALIFGLFLLYLVQTKGRVGKRNPEKLNKEIIQSRWQEVEAHLKDGRPESLKLAVVEADKLTDYVLKGLVGNTEKTMGERLKLAQKCFPDNETYQGVWEAHKLRNRLVHEMESYAFKTEVNKAIDRFKKGLRGLGVL